MATRSNACHPSYCGKNLTLDYPFALQSGCGHPAFRDLLFCINDVLMFHISSGSYRVLDIDYMLIIPSHFMTLAHLSNCHSIFVGGRGIGFVIDHWRAPYLNPTPDNVFMLIGCSSQSSLFRGFPGKHFPCRNVSGMGCEKYYGCRAWDQIWLRRASSVYGSGPPTCCGISYDVIKSVNLSRLDCQGYSSAYMSLAPLRVGGPDGWDYGIRVKYSVEVTNDSFCKACEATGGSCGILMDLDTCACV